MKKNLLAGLATILFVFGMSVSAYATLINYSDTVFQDDTSGLYWYNDPYNFSGFNESQIESTIDSFNVTSDKWVWDDWRLATQNEVYQLWLANMSTMPSIFTGWQPEPDYFGQGISISGHSTPSDGFWWDSSEDIKLYDYQLAIRSIEFTTFPNYQTDIGAFIVTDTAATVPEPSTIILFSTGLVSLTASGIRKKKKANTT